jgi:hypothetical protein
MVDTKKHALVFAVAVLYCKASINLWIIVADQFLILITKVWALACFLLLKKLSSS